MSSQKSEKIDELAQKASGMSIDADMREVGEYLEAEEDVAIADCEHFDGVVRIIARMDKTDGICQKALALDDGEKGRRTVLLLNMSLLTKHIRNKRREDR